VRDSSGRLFDRVVLIYNPTNPLGPRTLATTVCQDLHGRLPALPVAMQPTRYAAHARELAAAEAETGRPLIVAVSGDGIYNEVVNGIMDVASNSAVAAVAAGGNANDHRRSTRRMSLVDAIVRGRERRLDLLQLTVQTGESRWSRYAHSYIGFGLTPLMAIGLKRDKKGTVKELISVMRTFTELEPVEIIRADRHERYDSLVFANVAKMAKYGLISTGRPDDGQFEVVACPHGARWRIATMALRAATVGLGRQPRASRSAFRTTSANPVQVDGEVMPVAAGSEIVIDCLPGALVTIG